MATATDANKVAYNLIHNLGMIYDLTEEGIYRSMDWEYNRYNYLYWRRMGFICGTNFHHTLEDPRNYYRVDPRVYEEDQERNEFFVYMED